MPNLKQVIIERLLGNTYFNGGFVKTVLNNLLLAQVVYSQNAIVQAAPFSDSIYHVLKGPLFGLLIDLRDLFDVAVDFDGVLNLRNYHRY